MTISPSSNPFLLEWIPPLPTVCVSIDLAPFNVACFLRYPPFSFRAATRPRFRKRTLFGSCDRSDHTGLPLPRVTLHPPCSHLIWRAPSSYFCLFFSFLKILRSFGRSLGLCFTGISPPALLRWPHRLIPLLRTIFWKIFAAWKITKSWFVRMCLLHGKNGISFPGT